MISDFNRRITINRYEFAQDSAGGNFTLPLDTWNMWANVQETAGNKALDNMQVSYSKTFRVKVRYEQSRPILDTDEIVYFGNPLLIQHIERQIEGRTNFLMIDTYTTNFEYAEAQPPSDKCQWAQIQW